MKTAICFLLTTNLLFAAEERHPHIIIETNGTYVCGDRVPINVRPIDFVPDSLAWSVYPTPAADALRVDSSGAYADFTSRTAAKYTVVVSAAGKVDDKIFSTHAVKEFSLLANSADNSRRVPTPNRDREQQPPARPAPSDGEPEIEAPMQQQKNAAPGVDVLIKTWANEIPNAAFKSGRAEVAMLFAQKAREVQTQNVPMSREIVTRIFKVYSVNVPANVVTAWQPWFQKIYDLFKKLETEGALTSRENYVTALMNVSDILLGKV